MKRVILLRVVNLSVLVVRYRIVVQNNKKVTRTFFVFMQSF